MAQDDTHERTARQRADAARREAQLLELTGAFIRQWASTEWLLFMLMAALMECGHERSRIIWSSITSFRAKRELLSRLGESFLADELLEPFRKIISRSRHLSEKRNMIAHDRALYVGKGVFRFMNDGRVEDPTSMGKFTNIPVRSIASWVTDSKILTEDIRVFSFQISVTSELLLERERGYLGPLGY